MIELAVSSARRQWRMLLGSAVALTCGIALLAGTLLVIASAHARPPLRYAHTDLVVATATLGTTYNGTPVRNPWSETEERRLAASLRAVDGVALAVPEFVFPAQLTEGGHVSTPTERDDPLGRNISTAQLGADRLVSGTTPSGPDQVVAPRDSGLHVGDTTTLVTPAGRVSVTVSGVATGRSVYVDDGAARRWSGGAKAVAVALTPGADIDSVRAEFEEILAGSGTVLVGDGIAETESSADRGARNVGAQLLGAMGALATLVTVFIVGTTFAFTVTQRRQEIGLLRAVGATPGQVRRMLLIEAAVIGGIAGAAGSAAGCALAPILGGWMRGAAMLPREWEPSITPTPVLAAVATGIGVAVVGVWFASRRAARVRPLDALRTAQAERSPMTRPRWLAGVGGTAGTLAFAAAGAVSSGGSSATFAVLAVMSAVVGLTSLGPVYLPAAMRLAVRGRGPTTELVRAESAHGARRVSSVLSPILLFVGFAVMLTGMVDTMDRAFGDDATAAIPTELVVSPAAGAPALSRDVADSVRAFADGPVIAPLATTVVFGGRAVDAWGVDATELTALGTTVDAGDVTRLRPGTVVLDRDAADRLGTGVGATVDTVFPDGRAVPLEVVGVVSGAPAFAFVDRDTARIHDRTAMTPLLYVDTADRDSLTAALSGTGAAVETPEQYESAGNAEDQRLLRLFELALVGLSLTFAALAVANTMSMATAERRAGFALLRRLGATRTQIVGVVATESVVVASAGVILGVLLAWPALAGVAAGLAGDLGRPVAPIVRWSAVATAGTAAVAIALVAAIVPAIRSMRADR